MLRSCLGAAARALSGARAGVADAAPLQARCISSTAVAARQLYPPLRPERPEDAPMRPPQPDLVDRYLSPDLLPRRERVQLTIRQTASEFARFPGDVGSSEVQIACLTQRIFHLAEHLKEHRKDVACRRGLQKLLSRRKALLKYLRRKDFDAYAMVISRLGLKDNYGPTDRFSVRYRPAVREDRETTQN